MKKLMTTTAALFATLTAGALAEIAASVGYESQSRFSARFVERFGMPMQHVHGPARRSRTETGPS